MVVISVNLYWSDLIVRWEYAYGSAMHTACYEGCTSYLEMEEGKNYVVTIHDRWEEGSIRASFNPEDSEYELEKEYEGKIPMFAYISLDRALWRLSGNAEELWLTVEEIER